MNSNAQPTAAFPRVSLAHLPTPLDPMPHLARTLGAPPLYVKRDDCTGLAFGGNKARQLEFYLGDALDREATVVLTTGAVQSNFVRCTAAAAAKLGLRCEVQLENRVPEMDAEYHASGNVLLDQLLGAEITRYPEGEDEGGADAALDARAAALRDRGERPYVIHLSDTHPPLGALAYVDAALELLMQAAAADTPVTDVVVASGSAATHAGLLVGLRLAGASVRVHGVCVRRDAVSQISRVRRIVRGVESLLKIGEVVPDTDVALTDAYLGPRYGQTAPPTREAIVLAARVEGLLLDPVYTGKAMAGLIGMTRRGEFDSRANVVFVHTGGTPALFGYRRELQEEFLGSIDGKWR